MSCTLTSLTRRTALGLATLSLAALTLSAAHPAAAGSYGTLITANSTFPTGSGTISQPDFSGNLDGGRDYTNNGTPGQTFTTGSNPLGYLLTSLTLKGGGDAGGGYETENFVVDISSVDGTARVNNSLTATVLDTFTASAQSLVGAAMTGFFTIDLSAANRTLAPGTQYAYDIYSTKGYFSLSRSPDNPTPDAYADGYAFQGRNGQRQAATSFTPFNGDQTFFNGNPSYDRTFSVGLTANTPASAPEASQTLAMGVMVLGLSGLLAVARRRRAVL